jgi:hypothetical protein
MARGQKRATFPIVIGSLLGIFPGYMDRFTKKVRKRGERGIVESSYQSREVLVCFIGLTFIINSNVTYYTRLRAQNSFDVQRDMRYP